MVHRSGDRARALRHRASARSCCWSTSCLLGRLHASAATRCATWSAASSTRCRSAPLRKKAYDCVSCFNRHHMQWAWFSLFWVALHRRLHSPLLDGRHHRLEDLLNGPIHETHEHDVLVIGAGGAGLRAAIEASAARRHRSAWSASRCSARPTPSWPRAASPRRWPTSTTATTGRSTSPTPCAAASTSTTGAWPSCTPRRRPTACASSRPGARVFDRTKDGRILQRNFGGHRYPRLAHVGDRTGLEMIRTLQDHGIHQGIDVYMECTIVDAAQGRRPRRRRVRLRPRARPLPRLPGQGRSCWPPAASAAPTRSPATAGSTPATATRWPTTPAPS